MKFVLASCALVFALAIIAGCEKHRGGGESRSENASSGDARLDGAWKLIATEFKGSTASESGKEQIFNFSGDRMISPGGKKEDAAAIACDPSKLPAEIDISKTEANGKIDKSYGIYKIEGDTLTLCIAKSEHPADRPIDFKTSRDSKAVTMVLRKNK